MKFAIEPQPWSTIYESNKPELSIGVYRGFNQLAETVASGPKFKLQVMNLYLSQIPVTSPNFITIPSVP
jgi:hypothetical protein